MVVYLTHQNDTAMATLKPTAENNNIVKALKKIADGKTARLYDWWEINQVKNVSAEKTAHPCQMPLKVMDCISTLQN